MIGLTLLETMFAITVGAIVLIAATAFYDSAKHSANINKAVRDLNTIVAQTQSYMVAGGVSDLSTTTNGTDTVKKLQTNGYLPTPISDPWGQAYTGTFTLGGNTTATTTTITVVSLDSPTGDAPDKNCLAIGQALSGVATAGATDCSFVFTL